MKAFLAHIETARAQPHHVRKSIAYTAAAFVAGVVALLWFSISAMTGSFALKGPTSFGQGSIAATEVSSGSQLAGAAAALPEQSSAPHIEIVDAKPPMPVKESEKTFIPF